MNIDRVRVRGLFDHFDHDLEFHTNERIMIMISPNGFGKTTTLRLIDALFNQSIWSLARMPFREVEVSFDEGTTLIAARETGPMRQQEDRLPVTLTVRYDGEEKTFSPPKVVADPNDLSIPLSAVDDIIPVLDRVGPRKWRNRETNDVLDLDEVLTVFLDEFPPEVQRVDLSSPEWLQELLHAVAVRFIDTERLTGTAKRERRGLWKGRLERTVRLYSKELAGQVNDSIAKYGALSQSLDKTFPARLVAAGGHSGRSVETLREDLDTIEQQLSQLEEVGLLVGDQVHIEIPDLADVDESQRGVLAVYAKDTQDKLSVFDELYEKVGTFRRIANSRFRRKQVRVDAQGFSVVTDDGLNLDLEMLSSGEQHELVILYELLFRAKSNSLILIDEPELSLHVAWQERFVKDLEEIARVANFRAILATHSPEIIGDRWDLTVELSDPNGDR